MPPWGRAFGAAWWALVVLVACGRAPARDDDAWVVVLPRDPEQLDPRYVGDAYGLKLSRLLHASLVTIDPVTLDVVPQLAESVSFVDATHVAVELRAGLAFSDGSTLDAEDVVATFRALVDPRVKSRYASTYARIAHVEADGPRRVRFVLHEPHATFLTDLEMPVLRAEDAFEPAKATKPLVGAGPYRLLERVPGELLLGANPRFFGHKPTRTKLRFVVIRDDNTRALRLLGGAGDLALNAVPPLLVPLFEARSDFAIARARGVGTTYIGANLQHPILRDVRVRRALAHAIDREAVVRYKLGGRAALATSWIVPGHWAHDPGTTNYRYDPARSRTLLEAAGFHPDADGVRFRLSIRTGSDRFVVSLVRAMVAMFREVGIEVDVRPSETATLLADLGKGRFELTFLQVPEVFEPHVLSWFFGSDRIPELPVREGGNRWRFVHPELDRVLERGRAQNERGARVLAYRAAQHILARELPVIPLWHEDVVAIHSRRLEGYVVPRDGRFGTLAR